MVLNRARWEIARSVAWGHGEEPPAREDGAAILAPRAKGAMVPLVSSFLLSTKEGKKAWAVPVIDPSAPDGWHFEVRGGALAKADEELLKYGTKSAKGQAFICCLTGAAIDRAYIQAEGKADRLGTRLMAIVAERRRRRIYVGPGKGIIIPRSGVQIPVPFKAVIGWSAL